MKAAQSSCRQLQKGFDREWRKRVLQFQIPLFSANTKGAWVLRFDDIMADALESGPLKNTKIALTPELVHKISALTPKGIPANVIPTLVKYYLVNRQDDTKFVVLPITNFDAYFGTTSFGRKWLKMIPDELVERSGSGYGICRYRIKEVYIADIL
jgi:hypothetical protein